MRSLRLGQPSPLLQKDDPSRLSWQGAGTLVETCWVVSSLLCFKFRVLAPAQHPAEREGMAGECLGTQSITGLQGINTPEALAPLFFFFLKIHNVMLCVPGCGTAGRLKNAPNLVLDPSGSQRMGGELGREIG